MTQKYTEISDLEQMSRDSLEALTSGVIDTDEARARSSEMRNLCKLLCIRLDHAKLTDRLKNKSDVLPKLRIEQ